MSISTFRTASKSRTGATIRYGINFESPEASVVRRRSRTSADPQTPSFRKDYGPSTSSSPRNLFIVRTKHTM
jgi:hypothetical protein